MSSSLARSSREPLGSHCQADAPRPSLRLLEWALIKPPIPSVVKFSWQMPRQGLHPHHIKQALTQLTHPCRLADGAFEASGSQFDPCKLRELALIAISSLR